MSSSLSSFVDGTTGSGSFLSYLQLNLILSPVVEFIYSIAMG